MHARGCQGPAGGRLASHSSTTWPGQPMEFAPSLRAWGNVPSARHRHSVRRLTPTRSSTSGTRNMTSLEILGDMSTPPTIGTNRASTRRGQPRRLVARLAQHVNAPELKSAKTQWPPAWPACVITASGTAAGVTPAPARGSARHRRGDRTVRSDGHGTQTTKPPRTLRNVRERCGTLANAAGLAAKCRPTAGSWHNGWTMRTHQWCHTEPDRLPGNRNPQYVERELPHIWGHNHPICGTLS